MIQIFNNPKFDFVAKRQVAYIVSALVILAGLGSIVARGGLTYGIDFAGGLGLRVDLGEPFPTEDVRSTIGSLGIEGFEIQSVGSAGEVMIRVPVEEEGSAEGLGGEIVDALRGEFGAAVELRSEDMVGPKVGQELKGQAFKAVIFALIAIVAYITLRFEFRFGVAAIVTLTHDVLCVIGLFSIFGYEISLPIVAALLTIVGYSLNDTIVVFDRIREDTKLMRRESYGRIINASINQTLSRTVITSLTTLFPVGLLISIGGPVIHDFAIALLMGVLIGTYSSIFVASPVLYEWNERSPRATEPAQVKRQASGAKATGKAKAKAR
jgi:preprotein translocase subunit SecF